MRLTTVICIATLAAGLSAAERKECTVQTTRQYREFRVFRDYMTCNGKLVSVAEGIKSPEGETVHAVMYFQDGPKTDEPLRMEPGTGTRPPTVYFSRNSSVANKLRKEYAHRQ
jgi:hypothetical protein